MDVHPFSWSMDNRLVLLVVIASLSTITEAQTTNTSLFTFADYAPTIPSSAIKAFTTSINLIPISTNQSEFNESAFLNATTDFYSSAYPGFISVSVLRISNKTDATNVTVISFDVVYEVTYNYTIFGPQTADDVAVTSQIGSLTAVKVGLEADAIFQNLYNVSSNSTTFVFSGNGICTSASCGTSYVACSESSLGLSPMCRSTCFSNFVCHNGGTCVHRTANLSPNCNCVASSTIWYIGGRCEFKVEVWMIVVFLVLFLGLILLIILIGCICCRRKVKPPNRMKEERENRDVAHKVTATKARTPEASPMPGGYVVERDTTPLSPSTPMTSNALVTVHESSSESEESIAPPYRENTPVVDSDEPTVAHAQLAQSANPQISEESSDDSSSSSSESEQQQDVTVSGVSPRSSVAGSEVPERRYNSLHFPNSSQRDTDVNSGHYNTLDVASSKNRGTQTNTKINIVLPDSILMNSM